MINLFVLLNFSQAFLKPQILCPRSRRLNIKILNKFKKKLISFRTIKFEKLINQIT